MKIIESSKNVLYNVTGGILANKVLKIEKVQKAIDWAKGNNYQVAMVTFTASHNVKMSLIEFGEKLQKAYTMMMKNI